MESNSLIVIGSEILLALYPILIKRVPVNLATQLVSRFVTYTVLAFCIASPSDISQSWFSLASASQSMSYGALTLLHIAVSYFAFSSLPTGTAMSLFYTYPLWNMLGAFLFFGETFSIEHLFFITLAFIGVYLVSLKENKEDTFINENENQNEYTKHTYGVFAGLLAAITETMIYLTVRVKNPSPAFNILQLYPGGLILLLSGLFVSGNLETVDTSIVNWIPLLLFNIFIGFIGYFLRFYSIPRIETSIFSLLSFIGVVASYFWGYIFIEEIPTLLGALGSFLITLSAGASQIL